MVWDSTGNFTGCYALPNINENGTSSTTPEVIDISSLTDQILGGGGAVDNDFVDSFSPNLRWVVKEGNSSGRWSFVPDFNSGGIDESQVLYTTNTNNTGLRVGSRPSTEETWGWDLTTTLPDETADYSNYIPMSSAPAMLLNPAYTRVATVYSRTSPTTWRTYKTSSSASLHGGQVLIFLKRTTLGV